MQGFLSIHFCLSELIDIDVKMIGIWENSWQWSPQQIKIFSFFLDKSTESEAY